MLTSSTQSSQSRAALFRALHTSSSILVLPNAWDVASARLMEASGARAIATSSAAVAWAHGRADGGGLTREMVTSSARAIVRSVQLPVSVDIEAGYGDEVHGVAELARQLVDIGVVGINIEDGTGDPELLARKIETIKRAAGDAL